MTIKYVPEQHILVARSSNTLPRTFPSFADLSAYTSRHNCSRWLFDLHDLSDQTFPYTQRLFSSLLPRLGSKGNGQPTWLVALLITPEQRAPITECLPADYFQQRQGYHIGVFQQEEAALQWLQTALF